MNNTICLLPFHHLDISISGKVLPCCQFNPNEVPDDMNINMPNIFRHNFLENIRSEMLQGNAVKGCDRCYRSEKHSSNSYRIEMLQRYKKDFGKDFIPPPKPKLAFINLALSNLCNNKCRMCNSKLSTSWYADAKILGYDVPKGAVFQKDWFENFDIKDLEAINLHGGEPLMEQDRIVDILQKCRLEKLTLVITTNSTLRPNDDLVKLLKQCKQVQWNLSIDAVGMLNNFLRKGSDWDTVKENVQWYYRNFDFIKTNTVISIYNVNCFDKLYLYLKDNYPKIDQRHIMIEGVDWMQVYNLPEEAKEKVRQRVLEIKEKTKLSICDYILNILSTSGSFKNFEKMDAQINNIRHEHWKDFNTELYNWIYTKEEIC